jgi:hypothetical protein
VDEENVERITRSMGKLSEANRWQLTRDVAQLFMQEWRIPLSPSLIQLREELRRLDKAQYIGIRKLRKLSSAAKIYLSIDLDLPVPYLQTAEVKRRVSTAIGQVVEEIKTAGASKGGRPRNERVHRLAAALSVLYQMTAGKEPTFTIRDGQPTSPFSRFAMACFSAFWPAEGGDIPWSSVIAAIQQAARAPLSTDSKTGELPDNLVKSAF